MSKILIISGSPASPSRTSAIAAFISTVLNSKKNKLEILSLRELPAEALVHAQFNDPEIRRIQKSIEESEALIVVSPVYKASYPGILKSFFDLLPERGLEGKKVLPIVSGGSIAHLLSLEFVFKPLFSILGARDISQGVYLVDSQFSYAANQLNFLDPDLRVRLETAVLDLQDSLKDTIITVK